MRALRLELRDFRNYKRAELELGAGVTVVSGSNGAGKTNLLEALYFACTARSPRTANLRELVRRGAGPARAALETLDAQGAHRVEIGFGAHGERSLRVDGRQVESLTGIDERPLASVFLAERLELVKGPPSGRRAHLDQLVAALWPARAATRSAYSRALAQRNALLARIRAGAASADALLAWDAELARHAVALMADRSEATRALAPLFADLGERLGVEAAATLRYRPRSNATDATGLAAELAERRVADLERGFTAHGPHRDELELTLDGASLRAFGSRGQQRTALLALLFAERELLAERRARPPLMLLDDVMSELDAHRRALLAGLLRERGQAVVTATEPEHVPGAGDAEVTLVAVHAGALTPLAPAAA